jgi:hypothetical protein
MSDGDCPMASAPRPSKPLDPEAPHLTCSRLGVCFVPNGDAVWALFRF